MASKIVSLITATGDIAEKPVLEYVNNGSMSYDDGAISECVVLNIPFEIAIVRSRKAFRSINGTSLVVLSINSPHADAASAIDASELFGKNLVDDLIVVAMPLLTLAPLTFGIFVSR
jgi:hypothetical protein